MKVKLTIEIDDINVAEITTPNMSPKAMYNFEYSEHAAPLICMVLAECLTGIRAIESGVNEHDIDLH